MSLSLSAGAGFLLSPQMKKLFALPGKEKPAEHLIVLWMSGGPSHLDSFDPKPGRPGAGTFKPLATALQGVSFTEHLPRLAAAAKDLAVVRSMTSKEGSHARATYLLHTGYIPNPSVKYPSLGAMVSHERGKADFELPNFISLGGPSEGAGFFGAAHSPFFVRSKPGLPIDNLQYFRGVDEARFNDRLDLVSFLDERFGAKGAAAEVAVHQDILKKAKRMVQNKLVKAFNLDEEPQAIRDLYGAKLAAPGAGPTFPRRGMQQAGPTPGEFGARCLQARRLIEAGVPAVEVELSGWDTHVDNFTRTAALLSEVDPGVSGLIADLKQRGLLDKTLIVCMGEFGRSPKINTREGRDHHPKAFSAVLAGGGLRTGQVIGSTDADGLAVVTNPVQVADLFATVLTRLGIDPEKVYTSNDRPIALANKGKAISALLGS